MVEHVHDGHQGQRAGQRGERVQAEQGGHAQQPTEAHQRVAQQRVQWLTNGVSHASLHGYQRQLGAVVDVQLAFGNGKSDSG